MKSKKISIILWIVVILLTITYFLSFISNNYKESRKPFKSALLNSKYISQLDKIILFDADNAIELCKKNDIWFVNLPAFSTNLLPADQEKVSNLINSLSIVRNMYKISDNFSLLNDYELDNLSAFHIVYYTDPENYTELIFGKHDFTQKYRYFISNKINTIYEIETDLDNYLSSVFQTWTEGLIISQNIISKITYEDIQEIFIKDLMNERTETLRLNSSNENFLSYTQKLLELRQGGFFEVEQELQNPIYEIKVSLGNLNQILLNIYFSEIENEYILKETYFDYLKNSTTSYITKISGWTFNKLQQK